MERARSSGAIQRKARGPTAVCCAWPTGRRDCGLLTRSMLSANGASTFSRSNARSKFGAALSDQLFKRDAIRHLGNPYLGEDSRAVWHG